MGSHTHNVGQHRRGHLQAPLACAPLARWILSACTDRRHDALRCSPRHAVSWDSIRHVGFTRASVRGTRARVRWRTTSHTRAPWHDVWDTVGLSSGSTSRPSDDAMIHWRECHRVAFPQSWYMRQSLFSISSDLRPSLRAATPVLPLPANISNTVSCGLLDVSIIISASLDGFSHG